MDAYIHYACPRCSATSVVRAGGPGESGHHAPGESRLSCSACSFTYPGPGLPGSGALPDPRQPLTRCAVCGSGEFYVQKNFNRRVGLAVAALSALTAFITMVFWSYPAGLGLLLAVTLLDALIYARLGEVSVCYLCQSVYHGFARNPGHEAFYLGSEERFKALRNAWLEGLRP